MFTLLHLDSAEIVSRAQFADGKAAARAARLLTRKTGRRYQPRPVAAPVDWQAREQSRFESGEYVALCEDLAAIAPGEHFAHVAKKSPELIAYTKDAMKGAADKQSLLSIESYVDLVAPHWCADAKAALVKLQREHADAHCSPLQFAGPGTDTATADLIESVYTNYDSDSSAAHASCMRHPARNYNSRVDGRPFHPVRVYAGGDLAIAYLTNASGETIARALVWPEKKLYSRLYCGEDSTLSRLLKARGYTGAGYYGGRSMRGARLARVEADNGQLVAPYLDEVGNVEDCGECLRIGGDIDAQRIDGTADSPGRFYCESCEESYPPGYAYLVYTRGNRRVSIEWCEHCRDNYAFYCAGYEDYFTESVEHDEMNGETYSRDWLDNNASRCEHYEEWCDGTESVIVDEYGNTEEWGDSAISNDAFEYDGAYYSNSLDSELVTVKRAELIAVAWRALCYLKDKRVRIPRHLIDEANDEGAPIAFEASDGRFYAVDYVDCYPVDRPRLVSAENGQIVIPEIAA